ncbi:RHS repeat-associated core domain-containing protein (plasmid) [Burkholderia cepacia]|uniref:RHS repeat-associated core domain-containing protein n=1 Tax=Burkholderia cepacia TaxID=292 RepID=UPI003A4DB0AA
MSELETRLTRASAPAESHATQSESKVDTACDSLLGTVKSTFDPFKETFSSEGGTLHHVSEAVNSLASLQGMPSQLLNTGIAQIPLLDKMPGMPAATIGVPHLGTPHAHSHPPSNGFPLPSVGVTIGSGCLSVLIGGIPAARVLDIGIAPTCGGLTPFFDIQTGSSNTFIGGMRAARMGIDMTRHCNPMGHVGHSGGEAASAAEKGEEVTSESAQLSGRAKVLGRAGKAWSVGNAAVGPASGVATAADDASQGEIAAAAMMAAQTAADLAFMALSNMMGKDPGIEPSMGTLLAGDPTVLIGGFPLPDSQMMWHGAKHGIGKKVRPKLPKWAQKLACEMFGEPVSAVTGDVENNFTDYETNEVIPFKWGRYYNSGKHEQDGALGYGFRHTWQHELRLLRTRAVYTDPQGTEYVFDTREDGTYAGYCQGYVLERQGPKQFVVRHETNGDVLFSQVDETDQSARCAGHVRAGVRSILHRHTDGKIEKITQSDSNGHVRRVVTLRYDQASRIVEVDQTNIRGRNTRIATYAYDADGCLSAWRNSLDAQSTCEYNAQRRVVRLIDANGYEFAYRYDNSGRCVESTGQDGMWHVRFQYHPGKTIVTESDGGQWTILYNDVGTITLVVDPYGGTTQYVLGADGRIREEIDSGGRIMLWLYDARDRNTSRLDRWGNVWPIKDDAPNLANPLAHDVPGTPVGLQWGQTDEASVADTVLLPPEVEEITKQNRTPPLRLFDAVGQQHDDAGQMILRTDVHGNFERFAYDAAGNLLRWHDKDGREHSYTLASWKLRGSTTDPLGHTIHYRYSPRREIEAIVDASGNESTYTYDLKNRLTSVTRHGRLRESYVYDVGDRLIEKRDDAGDTLLYLEVGRNGLYSSRKLSSGETHTFEYNERGKVTNASTDRYEITRLFGPHGQLISDKRDDRGVKHEYVGHQLNRTTWFDRFEVRYESAADGEMLIHTPVGSTQRIQRAADGRVLIQLGNGTNALYLFDSDGRCAGRATWPEARPADVHSVRYEYSPTGELRSVVDNTRGGVNYHYDAAHRLIGESRDGWEIRRFEYDPSGNLLSTPTSPWMRYAEGNRLIAASSGVFHYDNRNHLAEEISGDGRRTTYLYNSLDLLVQVKWSDRADTWTAEYDGLCRRVATTMSNRRREYFWDGDRLTAEIDQDGLLRIYIYVNETALVPFMFIDYSDIDAATDEGIPYFSFSNQIGLPEWIEDECRRSVWSAKDIDPYGIIQITENNSIEYDLRWPGHWFDRETGLHYNRFRSYNPTLGRYLQSDPAGQLGGVNLYAYAANPLVSVDVLGLHELTADQRVKPDVPNAKERGEELESAIDKFWSTRKPLDSLSASDLNKIRDLYSKLDEVQNADSHCGILDNYNLSPAKRDEYERDHVPSGAAQKKHAETMLRNLGIWDNLEPKEQKNVLDHVYNDAKSVTIPKPPHVGGRTWGHHNTDSQIALDSRDLNLAFSKDVEAMQKQMAHLPPECQRAYTRAIFEMRNHDAYNHIESSIRRNRHVINAVKGKIDGPINKTIPRGRARPTREISKAQWDDFVKNGGLNNP